MHRPAALTFHSCRSPSHCSESALIEEARSVGHSAHLREPAVQCSRGDALSVERLCHLVCPHLHCQQHVIYCWSAKHTVGSMSAASHADNLQTIALGK